MKAKRELKEQAATLMGFRKLAEESERRENAFAVTEQALKVSNKLLVIPFTWTELKRRLPLGEIAPGPSPYAFKTVA